MGSGFRRMLKKAKAAAQAQQAKAAGEASVRNADKPKGRMVVISDVAPYALDGHPKCRGNGMENGNPNAMAPCPCAIKRFHKERPEIIVDATGQGWWPAKPDLIDEAIVRAAARSQEPTDRPAPCACSEDDRETLADDTTRRYECLTCGGDLGPYEDFLPATDG